MDGGYLPKFHFEDLILSIQSIYIGPQLGY